MYCSSIYFEGLQKSQEAMLKIASSLDLNHVPQKYSAEVLLLANIAFRKCCQFDIKRLHQLAVFSLSFFNNLSKIKWYIYMYRFGFKYTELCNVHGSYWSVGVSEEGFMQLVDFVIVLQELWDKLWYQLLNDLSRVKYWQKSLHPNTWDLLI